MQCLQVEAVVAAIIREARTGEIGDGKIFRELDRVKGTQQRAVECGMLNAEC